MNRKLFWSRRLRKKNILVVDIAETLETGGVTPFYLLIDLQIFRSSALTISFWRFDIFFSLWDCLHVRIDFMQRVRDGQSKIL